MNAKIIFLILSIMHHQTTGSYIKSSNKKPNRYVLQNDIEEWGVFYSITGLSKQKFELLNGPKYQDSTKVLLSQFMKEKPKYLTKSASLKNAMVKNVINLYDKNKLSKIKPKTSLIFVLSERPPVSLRRTRRKIDSRMVSDNSSARIDNLLKFYQQHGLGANNHNYRSSDSHGDALYFNYNDMDNTSHSSKEFDMDKEYAYDNLYDDEADVDFSAKSLQTSEYDSFQDLILQAKMNQLDLESEETKLKRPTNNNFD